jgi:preprotein translocase YajC subunit
MGDWGFYVALGVIILIFGAMMVFQTRRRRTAQAEYTGMLDTLRPGTRVKTVGGVIGKIKEIREEAPGFKTVLLETGSEGHTSFMLYDIQAIYGVVDEGALKLAQPQPADVKDHKSPDDGVGPAENVFETKKGKKKSGN